MTDFTVSDVARQLGIRPRLISDLFYERLLSDEKCPLVGGRRLIPRDYVPEIEGVLRKAGHLKGSGVAETGKGASA